MGKRALQLNLQIEGDWPDVRGFVHDDLKQIQDIFNALPTPLAGRKIYYVANTSGGATTRKLTFQDGLLISET